MFAHTKSALGQRKDFLKKIYKNWRTLQILFFPLEFCENKHDNNDSL